MGMVLVAEAAACSAGVALAMIRSTFSDTKPFTMVPQVLASPEAFFTSTSTLSPRASFSASVKPLVAASRASCCTSCTTPTLRVLVSESLPVLVSLLPQATMVRAMARARISAINFFMICSPLHFLCIGWML